MSDVEKKVLVIKIINQGTYEAELMRINAPLSIQALMKSLPLKGRAMKQRGRLVLPTDLKIRQEKPRTEFQRGDISIDPSSSNLSLHLDEISVTRSAENYLGQVQEFNEDLQGISFSILIKEK